MTATIPGVARPAKVQHDTRPAYKIRRRTYYRTECLSRCPKLHTRKTYLLSAPRLIWGLWRRIMFSKELWTLMSPLYSTRRKGVLSSEKAARRAQILASIGRGLREGANVQGRYQNVRARPRRHGAANTVSRLITGSSSAQVQ
jgi:hypothetical protein